jgi:hypothetical protein
MKLTEKQSKVLQIIVGIVGGAGIWLSIGAPIFFNYPVDQNSIFGWLWLVIFAVIMITQRALEKKYETRFVAFFRAYLVTLIAGLAAFIIYALVNHISFFNS